MKRNRREHQREGIHCGHCGRRGTRQHQRSQWYRQVLKHEANDNLVRAVASQGFLCGPEICRDKCHHGGDDNQKQGHSHYQSQGDRHHTALIPGGNDARPKVRPHKPSNSESDKRGAPVCGVPDALRSGSREQGRLIADGQTLKDRRDVKVDEDGHQHADQGEGEDTQLQHIRVNHSPHPPQGLIDNEDHSHGESGCRVRNDPAGYLLNNVGDTDDLHAHEEEHEHDVGQREESPDQRVLFIAPGHDVGKGEDLGIP